MLVLTAHARHADANDGAPWGSATEIRQAYRGQKVVFDTTSGSLAGLTSVLDRASLISVLNGADPLDHKIVIVLHGGAIPFFAIGNYAKNKDLMHRAQSLSVGGGGRVPDVPGGRPTSGLQARGYPRLRQDGPDGRRGNRSAAAGRRLCLYALGGGRTGDAPAAHAMSGPRGAQVTRAHTD